jgi:hypothetical protein
MTLGCSRKSVRLLTFRSSSRIWAELHERAFRRLGGATRIVVLDNLREGVLVPDIYDPALNPLYRDVLAHYGAVAMPCRIGCAAWRRNKPLALQMLSFWSLLLQGRYLEELSEHSLGYLTELLDYASFSFFRQARCSAEHYVLAVLRFSGHPNAPFRSEVGA